MNQNPEQIARDNIDKQLIACGWVIQSIRQINLNARLPDGQAGIGVAVKEYLTDVGPADYVLFVEGKSCGVIEAKREEEGHRMNVHQGQGEEYANAKLRHLKNEPLPFVYISTGEITRFTDFTDPKPRAREVFSFHRPETLREWVKRDKSLHKRFSDLPSLQTEGLRDCQINAITKLETSFKENRPRALIQMAMGSGKTFSAITAIYWLLKYVKAKRVLFLVDTKNIGEQAEQEFMSFLPNNDNRKFTELYSVQRPKSSYIATDSQVCISTIQRLYSFLKGTELKESAKEENPNEKSWQPKEIPPIEYDPKMPIEFFDFIVIDECHRSIYNLWKQVLEYYGAFEIGLMATPDKRTIGYFDQNLPTIFKDRYDKNGAFEVPKTLIFAKTDSHANDIIDIVRQEFAEENKFCKKITYKTDEDPKSVLSQFRNDYHPRIAVTVGMIATGTDVKPLECLLFMRDVKSIIFFEQMKGRGTRTIDLDSLRKVKPTAKFTKDHFAIVDAIGVTKSLKTDSRPLEKKPGVPLKDLLQAIAVGAREEELFTSLANRLTRLDKQLTEKEKTQFAEKANGKSVSQVVKELLNAFNPDEVIHVGWGKDNTKKAEEIIANFLDWMLENKDELLALQIFYNQPYRRRELTHNMVKEVLDKLQNDKPNLSPMTVWRAYATTGSTPIESTLNPLTALVSLIRKVCGLYSSLTAYDKTVDRNFRAWIFNKIAGQHNAFSEEQMQWLRMVKDYVSNSFHIDKDDFDLYPLNRNGGLGKFYQRFREDYEKIIEESDEALAA